MIDSTTILEFWRETRSTCLRTRPKASGLSLDTVESLSSLEFDRLGRLQGDCDCEGRGVSKGCGVLHRLERDAERSGLNSVFTKAPLVVRVGFSGSGLARKLVDTIDSLELAVSNVSSSEGTKVASLASES